MFQRKSKNLAYFDSVHHFLGAVPFPVQPSRKILELYRMLDRDVLHFDLHLIELLRNSHNPRIAANRLQAEGGRFVETCCGDFDRMGNAVNVDDRYFARAEWHKRENIIFAFCSPQPC
jgi:hypothetical protein